MKHLVLGAGGFLGQHLVTALASGSGFMNYDAPVTAVDREWRTYPNTPGGTAYAMSADVCDADSLRSINWQIYDTVWHLAALNDATQTFYDRPWDVLNTQIRGTLNVIDACVANKVKTLVLFSSSEVYQTPPVIPTPEDVPLVVPDLTNPRYSYGGGKIAAELLAWWSAIPRVIIIRPHNVYGPGQGKGHVIPDLIARIDAAPAGGLVDVPGAEKSKRSFSFVGDFTSACQWIWRRHELESATREVYHVGSGAWDFLTMGELFSRLAESLGRKDVTPAFGDGALGAVAERCPDITKLTEMGWAPSLALYWGLRETIAWYREQKQ